MNTLFDSSRVAKLTPSTFGAGTTEPAWDLMAEQAAFADALDRGLVHSCGPIPAAPKTASKPAEAAGSEWTAADWDRAEAFGLRTGNRKRPALVAAAPAPAPVVPAVVAAVVAAPAPARTTNRPTEADRAEWARMTLENALPGSFFIAGEPRSFSTGRPSNRKPVRRPMTWEQVRDAELEAARPAGEPFDSPEWEAWFALSRRFDS